MKKIIYLALIMTAGFAGCTKSDNATPIESQEFVINSTKSNRWTYFSFTENDTVPVTDPMTSSDWDLAFQRYRIKTNGGLSGNGQGCAANSFKKQQNGFDGLRVVPDTTTFFSDTSVQIAVQQGYATYILNPELYSWFSMEFAAAGTQIVPTDNIYIVKTATGKYAKVWFKSYYSTTNVSGYITVQYKYQPDGSRNLQ